MERLEDAGVVSSANHAGKREVLAPSAPSANEEAGAEV
jgi:DNA segregation ATPase FtsK/SpoIIIE-like protein